jgi:hypothetical protein
MKPKHGWPAAIAFLLMVLATELLPVAGGRGAAARFDWAFLYVTLHFVLLPIAAVMHIFWNIGALAFSKFEFRRRLRTVASVLVTLSYLVLLYFRPLFPLWADELWRGYSLRPPWT